MAEFRVSKYNPAKRYPDGSFAIETWTSVSDIGRTFAGRALDSEEYLATEDAYVEALRLFMEKCSVDSLTVADPEWYGDSEASTMLPVAARIESVIPKQGQVLSGQALSNIVRLILREILWCRLEHPSGFFAHFGYDFYMYIGAKELSDPPTVPATVFVEPYTSPYHREA